MNTHGLHAIAEALLELLPQDKETERLREEAHLRIFYREFMEFNRNAGIALYSKGVKLTNYPVSHNIGYWGTYLN